MAQLVGEDITCDAILHVLEGVTTIYTYNGSRFDLPFLAKNPGVDFGRFTQHDLMYDCWKSGHYGGLKAVEQKLGIRRKLPDLRGSDAVDLWRQHRRGDSAALPTLLAYNREDVENLPILRQKLERRSNRRT